MSVNDEWEKALNGYANIKWNPKQKQPKSPVGDIKKSDERYEPLVGGFINGLNGLERTAYQALGGINAQLAGWSANQQTRHTGDIERYKQSYENNPVLRKTAMTPEEYEKRRLENPSFWGQVLGGVDQKTKFTKEQAEELRQKWMLEEEKPWMDKANDVEDVRYTRMPANALEKVGVDLATNAPQLGEAALSGAALGSVLGPAGATLGAGLSMAKNIYGAAYGDERRKGRSIDASHGAAVADTLYQMPFEYVGASRIFKAIPGLRRAFGKLSPQGKSKFGEWLKTVRTEGSTEFLQQYGDSSADDIADAIETGKFQQDFEAGAKVMGDIAYENVFGENAGKNFEEAAYAGLLGGVMGGATHGAGMAIDALGRKLAGNPNITQADLEQAVDEAGQDIAQDGDSSFGNDALNFLANQTDVQLTEGQARNLAAAMAGNAFQESGYDSTVENGIGAYGSFQHLGDRKDALFNFAKENGLDPSSRQAQIAFAWKEMMTEGTLENQAFQEIMALGDNQPEAAAVIFRKLFERPGKEEANDEARMAEARRVHDRATKAREWLTNKRDTMDMDRADTDSVYDTINQILTESTDEQLLEQAKAFGFREEQEKDVNDQRQRAEQSIEQNAPQEAPKATPQPQGQAQQAAPIAINPQEQTQNTPVEGMATVNRDRTAPHIDRNKANKGNFNSRGNYNGRLDAPQNKRVESPIRNQGQSAPILQQGENQNAENLQTQTTERRENRENLNENVQPQQTQTAESQAITQNPQGNEVTPTLAPSNQGTAGIAQNVPKIASNGQNGITNKVNSEAFAKATEGNTGVVSGESEDVGEQGVKGDIALDGDGTVSAFKKAVNGILAKLKAGNVSQTRQKLTEARNKAIIRIAERKNNKEISEETADRLENRIDEIAAEAKEATGKASSDMLKGAFGMGKGTPSIFNKDAVEKIASNKKVKAIVDKMPKAEEEKQSKKAENNSEAKREAKDDGKKDKNPNKEETTEAKKSSQREEKFTNETVGKKDTEKAEKTAKEETKAPQEEPQKTKTQQKADAEKDAKAKKLLSKDAYDKVYTPLVNVLEQAQPEVAKAARDTALLMAKTADILHKRFKMKWENAPRVLLGGDPKGGKGIFEQIAWHGSPYTFDAFDLSKIGTGEGAQAHGWGLYFARDEIVSRGYKSALQRDSRLVMVIDGKKYNQPDPIEDEYIDENGDKVKRDSAVWWACYALRYGISFSESGDVVPEAKRALEKNLELFKHALKRGNTFGRTVEQTKEIIKGQEKALSLIKGGKADVILENDSRLYKVDIPENDVLLDEQKRYKDQPDIVKKGIVSTLLAMELSNEQKEDFYNKVRNSVNSSEETNAAWKRFIFTENVISNLNILLKGNVFGAAKVEEAKTFLEQIYTKEEINAIAENHAKWKNEKVKWTEKNIETFAEYNQSRANDEAELERECRLIDPVKTDNLLKRLNWTGRDVYRTLKTLLGSKRDASLALNKHGIKGITYVGERDGRCFVVFDDKAVKILETYEQQIKDQAAGSYNAVENLIKVFEKGNASTAVHESAHWYLVTLENLLHAEAEKRGITGTTDEILEKLAEDETMPKDLASELQKIRNWAQYSEETMKEYEGTELEKEFTKLAEAIKNGDEDAKERFIQERFARGYERYLASGKAPTKELQGVFARFRRWLLDIYNNTIKNLGNKPAPKEIQEIFDRMLEMEETETTGGTSENTPAAEVKRGTRGKANSDAEKEIKTQIETLATQLNNLAQKIENNDIMKEDNSNVSNKEESENVPERSAGLSGTVGMGESRSSEGEGTRNEDATERNSQDEGGNSGRELREKSSSNAGTDEGKTERSVSDTPAERVGNGRDDSARNESGRVEPTVKVKNVEKDIAAGKVKNARDTSGNDYTPTKVETENRSPKKRCEANIDAIAVLKKLETENRKATPTEQEILAGYSGWGGLSFAFDERSSSYSPETNQKLRDLLTETEYAEAKSEIISAFYTPPFVIQAMWKLANRLGFKGGRVLDPSCGVANFFTYMPTEMKGNSTALQGIDKSPIPARIAAQLFQSQKYKVDNSSYEKFARGDNFYDLAITNVPFSSSIYPVDKAVKGSYNLQDYYFAKSLQKVRPGGLIIFMTTHSTMDGTSSWQIRRELSLKTEFLGAIRLPSNLFDKAGAGVISDIVVLRKLNEGEGVNKESWGNYAKKKDKKGFEVNDTEYWKAADEAGGWKRVNNYWNEHPENVIGKVETTKGRYGGKDIVVKTENEAETQKLLDDAVNRFAENVYQPRVAKPLNTVERVTETVDPSVRYVGDIYENNDGQWAKAVFDKDVGRITGEVFPTSKQAQVGAFMAINKAQNDLMIAEVTPETTDKDLTEKRKALNAAYDKYLAKYGALNEKGTLSLVDEFPQIGRMLALENYTPPASKKRGAKGTIKKAEIFTKRVLYPEGINVKVETPEDALIASIQKFGQIDLEYMGNAIGSTQADLISNLSDKIIKDPLDERYVLLDEYLSGNVRAKLLVAENAAETDPDMKRNVELLKKVIPKDVEITDISIPLGSPVVTQEETQEFIDHMLGVRDAVTVKFNPVAGIWDVKRGNRNGYLTHQTDYIDYGVYIDSRNCADSAKLIEACLNTTDISNWSMFKVGNEDSAEMRKAREEAQQQAQLIREKIDREFKQWIEANTEVSARVKEAYNLKFNAFAPRKYDGSILSVNTTKHTPYAHQLNGALRAIMSKATLLNHCVGSGKSLTMMIAGMEMKRMGLANKIVYALPKNVVKQFEKEFYEDFPTAKILVLSSETLPRAPRTITYDLVPKYDLDGKTQLKDDNGVLIYEKKPVTKEEEARRRAILARRNATLQKIKTNDWDAILVSHNTFENIPVSDDVLIDFYQKEIKRYEDALEQEEFEKVRRSDKKGRTARRIQELLEKYRNMLTETLEGKEKYDVGTDTFETLGIDQIFVDESDLFKNLGFLTSLSQVKGVSTTGSGRAMDMFLKTQYLLHEPSAHGVVFATGTPISNSISEAYTLCRYLAPDELERLGCNSFDQFAKLFVNIAPAEEPKLDGSGYQYKTKVVGIRNAPECFRIINQFMDTKTVEDLPYIKERLPKARRTTITVKEPAVLSKFKGGLASRIKGFKGKFGKELPLIESRSRASIEHFKKTGEYLKVRDGYLKVAQDYKDITLCPYIYDSTLTGEEAFGRVWACADKAAEVYKKTTETKGTQVIFCDSSTPKKGEWSVYEELKQRLIAQGIPENEIAFVHDAGNNEAKRQEIFNAVRDGRIRILIGSTEKMGAGTNMQDRLVALHHLDAPWRPRDIEQREGRILRNGNKNKEVDIFTYVTEGSYDMNLYNLLSTKQSVFSQILHGSEDVRETDTEGVDNNNFAEIEKLANNDPTQVMYLEKQQQLRRLEAEKAGDVAAKTHAAFVVNSYGEKIARDEANLADSKKDVAEAEKIGDKFTIKILGDVYTDREKATDAFKKALQDVVKTLAAEFSKETLSGRYANIADVYVQPIPIAKIGSFDISVGISQYFANNHDENNTELIIQGATRYGYGTVSAAGAWNAIHSLPTMAKEEAEANLALDQKELEQAHTTLDRKFDKDGEIEKLKKEVADLKDAINKAGRESFSAETDNVKALTKTVQAVYEQDLTDREKGLIAFGRKMGVTVSFFTGDSRLHGWQNGDAIFLNRDMTRDVNQVFWHETFHWLKRNNPKLYEALKKAVLQNDDIAAQVKAWKKKTGRTNLTEEEAIEEMLADAMFDASTRGKFFETLGITHPTLVQKLIKWIRNTYRDLVNQFRHTEGFKPEAGLTNTQIDRMSRELDKIVGKLVDGNGNRLFEETTVQDDSVKYSVNLNDLSQGKVLNDALKNAMASRVQEKMEIMKESDAAHYLGKYTPKQPKARPNVSYDTSYGKKKRDKAWELLNYGVLAYIRSPSRLANPIIKQIYTWAEDAKRTQNKFYSKWTEKHKEILDLVQDAKDYAGYVDVLLTEDSDKRVFSDGELRSLGYSDKVIKAHKKVRDLLQEIRAEVAKIYQAEHVETKNFKSKAEADFWAKNPMFKNVEVKAMNKENGTVWQVKYTTPQYVERTAEVNIQLLDELKRRQQPQGNDPADVYILEWQDHQEEVTGATTFTVKYLESRNKLANLDQYIPHFFHEFLVIEVKNGTRRVVGSGTTLNEAVAVANNLAAGSKSQFFIAPKGFAYEDSTQALGIVGDKDLTNLSEALKAELEVSLEEAREAVKGNSHHIFLSALQHRKGAKGWETNMRWVIQHHISNTARYCALEPFKQMAMNLFERRFGSFSDSYLGKVIPDFTKGLINSVLGVPSKAEEITNAILSCLPIFENVPRPSRAVTSSIVGAMAVLKLGVSPAAAFINLTQFINLQGYIGSEWTLKGMNAAWNLSEADARLLEELGTREETGLETVDVSEETELIVGRFSKELKALKAAADKSMVLFTKAESFLRTASILGAYRKALAEGKTERAARAYALEVNRNVNFNYGVEDAPRMFRALQGSVAGDMFLQFKKYGFKELEVICDMLTNKNIPKSQKLMFFGEYFLLGGLFNSIPFQDLILALLGFALDEDDPEAEMKKWLMEFGKDNWAKRQLALIGMYGLGGAAGVDISQRVGFRSLVPEAENPFGVTGSTVAQVANALMNGDPIGMLKSTSPALGNLASAYAGYNTDSKGRVSYTYKDPFERVVRAAGFRTTGEALSVDKQRILNEDRSQREKQRKEAREAYFDNPSAENRRRLKELGYTDTQIKNLKPNDPTLERTERMRKNLSKREQKEFKEILEW